MVISDAIEVRGKSKIQHGSCNDRVYLIKLHRDDCPGILDDVERLAMEKGYSKIFAKTPSFAREEFLRRGYRQEAHVPEFYNGGDDAFFWGKYLKEERSIDPSQDVIDEVLTAALKKRSQDSPPPLRDGLTSRIACESDAEGMAEVYKVVFETYPFPIHDPAYLRKTMRENIVYYIALEGGRIAAVASSEMDEAGSNVEMTDFATLPGFRGSGIALSLLDEMEHEMKRRGIQTAYTIARAYSFGMNITFAKLGYEFGGTLIRNTHICGELESMNVWYKSLK